MGIKDFFISYCIGIKEINLNITWKEQPQYRKIIMGIFFCLMIILIYFNITFNISCYNLVMILAMVILIIGINLDSSKNGQKKLLPFYKNRSLERKKLILKLLEEYKIDFSDQNKINLLIEEVKIRKIEENPFEKLGKKFKLYIGVIIPVICFFLKETVLKEKLSKLSENEVIIILIITTISIYGILYIILPVLKYIFYRDDIYYDYLINDLKEVKIFKNNIYNKKQ